MLRNSESHMWWRTIVGALMLIVGATSLQAGEVSLAWDATTNNIDGTPSSDLVGYRLYHGFQSGHYSDFTNVNSGTTIRMSSLQTGVAHYFAITAFNAAGVESEYSAELIVELPAEPLSPVDSDANGLPDAWEIANFGSLGALGMSPQDDTDSDGCPNLSEYVAGTDPLDPASLPALRTDRVSGRTQGSFMAVQAAGVGYEGKKRFYTLQRCDDLNTGTWIDVPGASAVLAQNQVVSFPAADPQAGSGYYRFSVQLQ